MQKRRATISNDFGLDKPILQRWATPRNGCQRIVAPKVAGSSPVGHPPILPANEQKRGALGHRTGSSGSREAVDQPNASSRAMAAPSLIPGNAEKSGGEVFSEVRVRLWKMASSFGRKGESVQAGSLHAGFDGLSSCASLRGHRAVGRACLRADGVRYAGWCGGHRQLQLHC
jgi:hypothetical protein